MIASEAGVFLIGFLVMAGAGFYFARRFAVSKLKRFQLIISYLGGISALLITLNIYITIRSNNRIEKNRIAYNTIQNIRSNYLEPQREIIEKFPETFALYASMNQDTDLSAHIPEKYNKEKQDQAEVYFSIRAFQAVEDFLTTAEFDITGGYVWLNNFLMWMQSPILQKYWAILGFNYSDDTRELIGRIIEKSNELIALRQQKGKLSFQDYDAISKNLKIAHRK